MGSCDDVLLQSKKDTAENQLQHSNNVLGVRRSVRVRKKRRFTYPVVLLDQQAYSRQFQENNNTKDSGLLLRRWSTISQIKRRRTLSKITTGENKPDVADNSDGVITMALETRLSQYSLGYKTQLQDEEKTEEKESQPEQARQSRTPVLKVINDDKEEVTDEKAQESTSASPALNTPPTGANTSTTLMDSGVNINSSLIANPPSSSVHTNGEQNNDNLLATNTNESSTGGSQSGSSTTDEESVFVPMPENSHRSNSSSFDMILFLFGFLFFPLWWVGAWNYIMQTQTKSSKKPKRREVFQILNCCMSLSSLILLGLIIGLVTVWA
ncbi:unnamed protein product [Mucor hiemalis]